MKTTKLSDKIEDGGCVIEANGNKDLLDIDRNKIIKIFENKVIILFKNFNIDKDQIVKFTDRFTLQYANDANRREIRFENPKLRNVDPGKMEMPLHSEASYSPSWPEIVWFYCRLAPKKSSRAGHEPHMRHVPRSQALIVSRTFRSMPSLVRTALWNS